MHIEHCANPSVAAQKAGGALSQSVKETTAPVLLLFSGGSSLKILDYVEPDMFSSRVTIGVLDERVSADPAINNYLQLLSHPAIVRARDKGAVTINTVPFDHETPQELAGRFEHTLRQWSSEHPDGKIIATVGMGPDGHTFGMMPYPEDKATFDELFVDTYHWVVGYDAGIKNMYPLRATTTVAFSNEIHQSIWYVCGHDEAPPAKAGGFLQNKESFSPLRFATGVLHPWAKAHGISHGSNKTAMLNKALDPKTNVYAVPARIIQDMHKVTLFTDCPITE